MTAQVVQEVCYLEESTSNRDIPPGFLVKDVNSTPKPGRLAGWLGGQRAAQRIVYKERCRLHWNDLELVSFLPGGGMLGYWCRCELFVQVTEPEQLLDELGTEEPDGRWTVSRDALGAWFREPIAAALETLGAKGDLCSEPYWATVAKQVPGRLRCPRGVMIDQPEEQQTNAFILHKILTFEQYLRAIELYIWFLERLRQLGYDRQLVRVQLATERGGDEVAEKVLNEVGEDILATLITPEERKQSATKRLSSYIELAGSAADSELRPGVTLGRYELLTPLGQGGQGQVWKAWDSTAELFVVLKLVPRELHNATEEMNRLRSTFHIIQKLHHSNICPVLLLDRDPRFGWYQVMQYIDGQTLSTYRATYTARYGSFPLDQVVKVLRPVAEALDYAHGREVIHRDIKPANIMVSGEAEDVQLVDFGLAAAIRTSLSTVSGRRMDTSGARPYMAPEQWRGEHQDQATDQYGLAVVAYELLAGHPPFDSPDFDILSDCVQNRVPPAIADQPATVNRVLVRGLAKKRSERYPNCIAFVEALAAWLDRPREVGLKPELAPGRRAEPESLCEAETIPLPEGKPSPKPERWGEPPLAMAPFSAAQARDHQTAWAAYLDVPMEINNSLGMPMILIPPGEFVMGSPRSEEGHTRDEEPQRRVRITRPYYVG